MTKNAPKSQLPAVKRDRLAPPARLERLALAAYVEPEALLGPCGAHRCPHRRRLTRHGQAEAEDPIDSRRHDRAAAAVLERGGDPERELRGRIEFSDSHDVAHKLHRYPPPAKGQVVPVPRRREGLGGLGVQSLRRACVAVLAEHPQRWRARVELHFKGLGRRAAVSGPARACLHTLL